ncbi:MAG: MFS transporter [Planctomycetota bacterium]
MEAPKRSPQRSPLGQVLLTVFLDIVGFSILFPLFPAMLDHYVGKEGPGSLVGRLVERLAGLVGGDEYAVIVLFGGVLGSLYSILQFIFSPIWGSISDRIGRRSMLLFTLTGTFVSYIVWIFSGSFLLLVASRLLAGAMAGNISIASAVVADTTSGADRAKGMGLIGMSIGLGFIFGPTIGALAMLGGVDTSVAWDSGLAWNPFSRAALAAAGLALANLLWVAFAFRESLPPERRGLSGAPRGWNPFGRLGTLSAIPGVVRANLIYFLFLTAFAAMEFTLTFLAVERLNYTIAQNTWLFVFIGLTIAVVQGGVVRRVVPLFGEKKIAILGLLLLVPGLVAIGFAQSSALLYVGGFLLAVGDALAMPCFSSMVSRYTPEHSQGLALGTLRSFGSLSRAIGPVLGGLLYWKFGSAAPYWTAALFLFIPILLSLKLPDLPPSAPRRA